MGKNRIFYEHYFCKQAKIMFTLSFPTNPVISHPTSQNYLSNKMVYYFPNGFLNEFHD